MEEDKTKTIDVPLRIWWNSCFGQQPFQKNVKNIKEAKYIISLLTAYDLYLGDKIVANACGLEVMETIEGITDWCEYYDEEGRDITTIMDEEEEKAREKKEGV